MMVVRGGVVRGLGVAACLLLLAGCRDKKEEAPVLPPPPPNYGKTADTAASSTVDSLQGFSAPELRQGDAARPAPAPEAAPGFSTPEAGAVPSGTVKEQSRPATVPADAPRPVADGQWVLQVGIHKQREGALKMQKALRAKGISAYILEVSTGATGLAGSYLRVRTGSFASRDEALAYGEKVLKPLGYPFWADKKSNEAAAASARQPSP